MASQAVNALGMIFEVGASTTVTLAGSLADVFVEVPELFEIMAPAVAHTFNDVTPHNNTTGFRDWLPSGLSDIESFDITINLLTQNALHGNIAPRGLMYLQLTKTPRNFVIRYPSNDWVWRFGAYVEKFAPDTTKEGPRRATVTFKGISYMDIV